MDLVFTPDNEPYLGRELLHALDLMICSTMETNSKIAPKTHAMDKSDLQHAACQLIPQAVSLALSIRELIRQGYLFGAWVLVRPLAERAAILIYLHENPSKIDLWNKGWPQDEAPSLSKMIEFIAASLNYPSDFKGYQVTSRWNSALHGKPDCWKWSVAHSGGGMAGHSPSKNTMSPQLCDEICAEVIPWLACVLSMMAAYFPR